MIQIEYTIKSEEGLHARPASDFCKTAERFESDIRIKKDGEEYNAKSILMVLCVGAMRGDVITITADGKDEKEAIDALIQTLDME